MPRSLEEKLQTFLLSRSRHIIPDHFSRVVEVVEADLLKQNAAFEFFEIKYRQTGEVFQTQ